MLAQQHLAGSLLILQRSLWCVLVGVTIDVMKHMTEGSVGRKVFVWFTLSHQVHHWRESRQELRHGRNLEAGTNAEVLGELFTLSLFLSMGVENINEDQCIFLNKMLSFKQFVTEENSSWTLLVGSNSLPRIKARTNVFASASWAAEVLSKRR